MLKERLAIFKRNELVKQKLNQTQALVEQNAHNIENQNVFSVQNVRLQPREHDAKRKGYA